MREYDYQITDTSVEALRRLRGPWRAVHADSHVVVVSLADAAVRLSVEGEDVAGMDVQRVRADLLPLDEATAGATRAARDPGDLALGTNDVVLFNAESWTEAAPHDGDVNGRGPAQVVQFTGPAGSRSPTAGAVCSTTDAVVAAAATGEGMLIRIGVRPFALEVVTDRLEIARFLVVRGYTTD